MTTPLTPKPHDSIALGFFATSALNALLWFLTTRSDWIIGFVFFGAIQLFWLFPCILFARHQGYRRISKGIIIAGALFFLLNAAGWGICFASLSKI